MPRRVTILATACLQRSTHGSHAGDDLGGELGVGDAAGDHLGDDGSVAVFAVLGPGADDDGEQLLHRLGLLDGGAVALEPFAAGCVERGEEEGVEAAEVVEDQRLVDAAGARDRA
jgi:hypothetical protein